jgi:hypothetical protein
VESKLNKVHMCGVLGFRLAIGNTDIAVLGILCWRREGGSCFGALTKVGVARLRNYSSIPSRDKRICFPVQPTDRHTDNFTSC